jgi:IS4 transposase
MKPTVNKRYPDKEMSKVLDIYRYRWQVELYFKRLRSILDFGELPKKIEESIFAWLNGKLKS